MVWIYRERNHEIPYERTDGPKAVRSAGYRVTKQRAAIYEYLLSNDAHPTAETIHHSVRCQLPGISLATVYKAVDSLIDVGLVNRIQRGASSARYDAPIADHAHWPLSFLRRPLGHSTRRRIGRGAKGRQSRPRQRRIRRLLCRSAAARN